VRIERHIRNTKCAIASGRNLASKSADGIGNLDLRATHRRPRRVLHHAFNRSGISHLRKSRHRKQQQKSQRHERQSAPQTQTHEFFLRPMAGLVRRSHMACRRKMWMDVRWRRHSCLRSYEESPAMANTKCRTATIEVEGNLDYWRRARSAVKR